MVDEGDCYGHAAINAWWLTLRLCSDLPRVMTTTDLAGCAYVVEGAALGGQMISRELDRSLGIRSDFFAGEGRQTSVRFAEVLAWIDDVALADSCPDEVVRAACDTFTKFERWLARGLEER